MAELQIFGIALIASWCVAPFACAVYAASRGAHPVVWFTAGVVIGPFGLLYALWRLGYQED